jgi:hypothetical protein
MEQELEDQASIDLAVVKSGIAAVNALPIASHSAEFEKIHKRLQQALTNLDGV